MASSSSTSDHVTIADASSPSSSEEQEWTRKRQLQMQDSKARISKKLIGFTLVSSVLLLKLGLGVSVRKISAYAFMALVSGIISQLSPAPKRNRKNPRNEVFTYYPFVGQIGWFVPAITECPVKQQLKEAKILNFKASELCLLGGTRDCYIFDQRDIEYVLRDNWRNFTKNAGNRPGSYGFLQYFCEILGRGIFAVDGDEWSSHRKTASYMFSNKHLANKMEASFAKHGRKLVKQLASKAAKNEKFNIQDVMQSLTFDSICDIAFGVDTGALEASLERNERIEFLVLFDRVQQNSSLRFVVPAPIWRAMRKLDLGWESAISRDSTVLRKYIADIIRNRKNSPQAMMENQGDLLSLYIDAANKSPERAHLKDDDYLSDMILNFQIAGRDTTACTLTNLFFELSNAPHVAQKMREEYAAKLGNDRDVSMDDLKELRYCCSVFNEVLRLHPPVMIDGRICNEADCLPSGFDVPAGTFVWIPNSAIGRDPSKWKEPDSFLPERWLESCKPNEPIRRVDEFLHPVFWGGPRVCIGKDAARLEVISMARIVLQKFDLVVAPGHDPKIAQAPVQFYENGLWGFAKPV